MSTASETTPLGPQPQLCSRSFLPLDPRSHIRPERKTLVQAQARREWDFPHFLNPMTTRDLSYDDEIPSFDDDTVASLDSKLKTSRFISVSL